MRSWMWSWRSVRPLASAGSSDDPVLSLDFRGPVSAVMTTDYFDEGRSDAHLELQGDQMVYDGATRKMRLQGNVRVTSVQQSASGKPVECTFLPPWVEVVLDETWQVVSVKAGPGTALSSGGGQ